MGMLITVMVMVMVMDTGSDMGSDMGMDFTGMDTDLDMEDMAMVIIRNLNIYITSFGAVAYKYVASTN